MVNTESTQPDAVRLLHELEVHQTELQMQNEELVAARSELERTLSHTLSLFDWAPVSYFVIGQKGRITRVNHAAAQFLECGVSLRACVEAEDRDAFDSVLRTAYERRPNGHMAEVKLQCLDGKIRTMEMTASTTRDGGDLMVSCQDISERKAKEQLLIDTEAALRKLNERKDQFLCMLSHELRNPLAPILSSVDLLTRTDSSEAAKAKATQIIKRQTTHIASLVDDLLDVTRVQSGKVRLKKSVVDLRETVRCVAQDYEPVCLQRARTLRYREAQQQLHVDADSVRIAQCVSNLMSNALKFTREGGIIEMAVEEDQGAAHITVSDNGAGIDSLLIGDVLEPFVQGDQGVDRKEGGMGLGLALVRSLVEEHGGSVRVASEGINRGTTVCLTLPLVGDVIEETQPDDVDEGDVGLKVLIIDDNEDFAEVTKDLLELRGHRVSTANDGAAGVAEVERLRPDVVLCDVGLPSKDGFEVARCIRARWNADEVYLVMLTGYAQPEFAEKAEQAGADEYLCKPPDMAKLCALLCNRARRRQAH